MTAHEVCNTGRDELVGPLRLVAKKKALLPSIFRLWRKGINRKAEVDETVREILSASIDQQAE